MSYVDMLEIVSITPAPVVIPAKGDLCATPSPLEG